MFDWFGWGMGLAQGLTVSVIGGVILLYFILPKMAAKSAHQTLEAMKNDDELKPIIEKAKEIITRLEPVTKKLATAFANIDLDKLQDDVKPFIEMMKKVDPKDVEDLLKEVKSLTGTIKKSIEKPEIPKPES
jgi:predicted RNA-binding protein with EMAP domain